MRLTKLYVRFYRSFNYDYERKSRATSSKPEWEFIDGVWFPFVRVDLDPAVTAVVGANESGKSHLIGAVKAALTGETIHRREFCRYSSLFSVETGRERDPDFGVEVELGNQADVDAIGSASSELRVGDRVTLLRLGGGEDRHRVVVPNGQSFAVSEQELEAITAYLPAPFELETALAIPDSISFDEILERVPGPLGNRRARFDLSRTLASLKELTAESVTESADEIVDALAGAESMSVRERAQRRAEVALARSLLLGVARISRSAFEDLEEAIRIGEEGRVGGLIEEMNRSLARHLNFSKWWRQDRDFQLRLAPRERELVFTIRDRTGTDYSFKERSRGLTYFLSYFVQLKAHDQDPSRAEILLMDEPDAYLSSAGQQDLLRTLENFARPEGSRRTDQVVYVTHSPFLINKNAAHRIRVLDKGSNEEGTRVVKDVARNHYEPLRSSVGSHVAETSFIGGSNLIVEGLSDQVLLAGLTTHLRQKAVPPGELLDLNEVTIVPAGSAPNVPYATYLARGRDALRPSCVALLDGDDSGKAAAEKLAKDAVHGKQILPTRYIVLLDEWADDQKLSTHDDVAIREIEDLIPVQVAAHASRRYAEHLLQITAAEASALTHTAIATKLPSVDGRMWLAVKAAFADAFKGEIAKVGFTKELIDYVESVRDQTPRPDGLPALEDNFQMLICELASRLRMAHEDESERRRAKRLKRIIDAFLGDYPEDEGASRDSANTALRDIESGLGHDATDDAIAAGVLALRRDFKLGTDPTFPVENFVGFRDRFKALGYIERFQHQGEPTD